MRPFQDILAPLILFMRYYNDPQQCILVKIGFSNLFQQLQCLGHIQLFFLVEADPPDTGNYNECRATMVLMLLRVR